MSYAVVPTNNPYALEIQTDGYYDNCVDGPLCDVNTGNQTWVAQSLFAAIREEALCIVKDNSIGSRYALTCDLSLSKHFQELRVGTDLVPSFFDSTYPVFFTYLNKHKKNEVKTKLAKFYTDVDNSVRFMQYGDTSHVTPESSLIALQSCYDYLHDRELLIYQNQLLLKAMIVYAVDSLPIGCVDTLIREQKLWDNFNYLRAYVGDPLDLNVRKVAREIFAEVCILCCHAVQYRPKIAQGMFRKQLVRDAKKVKKESIDRYFFEVYGPQAGYVDHPTREDKAYIENVYQEFLRNVIVRKLDEKWYNLVSEFGMDAAIVYAEQEEKTWRELSSRQQQVSFPVNGPLPLPQSYTSTPTVNGPLPLPQSYTSTPTVNGYPPLQQSRDSTPTAFPVVQRATGTVPDGTQPQRNAHQNYSEYPGLAESNEIRNQLQVRQAISGGYNRRNAVPINPSDSQYRASFAQRRSNAVQPKHTGTYTYAPQAATQPPTTQPRTEMPRPNSGYQGKPENEWTPAEKARHVAEYREKQKYDRQVQRLHDSGFDQHGKDTRMPKPGRARNPQTQAAGRQNGSVNGNIFNSLPIQCTSTPYCIPIL